MGIHESNIGFKSVYENRIVPAVDLATINDIWNRAQEYRVYGRFEGCRYGKIEI
ncbi:MAG: hypothetical protein IT524_00005 [Nitrosomonas sp.]|nr:hypothetical protein [Nitrosomonas sp.]